ncbi:MAG: hypothetical protein CBE47_01790 [Pelagibacteraceae bacterium TMED287]|nr:MAG: hypothetical protein CBE47_01790 [Pelagibacteraceae bacterium TMED287]
MAYRVKKTVDTTTSIPLGRLAKPIEISSYVKKIINASQYDFHESEAFEVTEVVLNESLNRGSVFGSFINNPGQEILGGIVKPLIPHITTVPLVGEHVVVVEYNGQHYYTSIINRKGSVNENSIPGVSTEYVSNTKYGANFERKKVKQIQINEGSVLFEGRFGQSIHFDGENNSPTIRIRTNVDETDGDFIKENIDTDDSSITMTSDGRGINFDGQERRGKNIIIKSDNIFISGDSVNINSKSGQTIKMGNPTLPMKPTVRGDVLLQFQADVTTLLSDIQQLLVLGSAGAIAAKSITLVPKIKRLVETISKQKFLNKDILAS